ncbi:hypothetical protein [Mucilaginibacter paludis]|uniref:Uncharacterized protein n=1 Tax=Mucilaginibacter paludis DSM 18603 TaxID=714943 RepID=H1YDT3_9SPHI|nr:hypothetical protein [Mucilaginibacter paludis]EHQ24273.1 hypothetical protein Mucpa_0070 [Mucilaginibacter paludis DSM 18603]
MSILANKTEKAAVKTIARCLKYLDGLSDLEMTAEDAFAAREAERLIKGIMETNGYTTVRIPGRGIIIKKVKS